MALIHKYDYIQAIKHASHGILSPSEANKYGLNTDDTFQFRHMHRHSARIVGGALNLADEIMNENILNGCHLGGGLHHSLPDVPMDFAFIMMLPLQQNILLLNITSV